MPKLRNASTVQDQFAQWIARKCRNHHPLEEVGLPARDASARATTYVKTGDADLGMARDAPNKFVYRADGRVFVVEVTEVDPEQLEEMVLVTPGF